MKKIFSIALMCAALFASCERSEGPEPDGQGNGDKYSIELPASDVNGKHAWMSGDQILIHGGSSKDQVVVTLTPADISEDRKTCYVSVEGVTPYEQNGVKSKYYMAYPAEAVQSVSKDINTFSTTNALLLTGYDKGKTFVLESLVGGIAFTVSADVDSYEFRGNNDEIVGLSSLSCRVNTNSKIYASSRGTAQTAITGTVVADGITLNHICFPDQPAFTDGFHLVFYKGGNAVKSYYIEDKLEIKRSEFIDLGDITSKLKTFSQNADTHKSAIPTAGAVNLGAVATANCYIVTEPGVYTFKAVKGNSTTALSSIGSVELLWESWGTTEEVTPNSVIAAVDFEKDQVYFQVAEGFHPGNAVIAVRNDMDAIMWSWHIWVPETAISEDLYGLSRRKSMSRNLGALVDASAAGTSPKAAGLFYQWGRKDPFVGVGDYATGEPASVAGQEMTLFGGQMSVAKTTKNPIAFANATDASWNEVKTLDLWGTTKTMYDPCPPGYRVPYRSEHILYSNYPWDAPGWSYDASAYMFTVGNSQTIYPLGGYITTNGEYAQYGTGTRVWCCRESDNAAEGYNFRIFNDTGSPSYGNGTKPKANGFAVRCVTEESFPFENLPGTPVKGAYELFTLTGLNELSGLCLSQDKTFLWGVGDQGEMVKISFDGQVERQFKQSLDMEAITIDPVTGNLYMGCEPSWVGVVNAPDYTKAVEIFRVADAENYGNSGVEGISWYKDDMILVGAQTGANLWAYTLDGTVVWKKSLKTVAIGCQEIADICYDPVKDQIWIIDSESQSIYLLNGDATQHLATYKVNYAGNCESICLDYDRNCVWVADDTEPSRLFKVDFTF